MKLPKADALPDSRGNGILLAPALSIGQAASCWPTLQGLIDVKSKLTIHNLGKQEEV